ncbi:MAG: hypothetical protein ACE5IJ_10595 [Thermoplasmata archaeon]
MMERKIEAAVRTLGNESTSGSTFPVWVEEKESASVEEEEIAHVEHRMEGVIDLIGGAAFHPTTGPRPAYHREMAERGLVLRFMEVETTNRLQSFPVLDLSRHQALAMCFGRLLESQHIQVLGPVDVAHRFRQLTRAQFERERDAFLRVKPELIQDRALQGKYVAVVRGKVVDTDEDDQALAERVYARFGYRPIYIGFVGEELPTFHSPTPL